MMIAIWIVGGAATYSMCVGIAFSLFWGLTEFDKTDSFAAAVSWPLSLPVLLGFTATGSISDVIYRRRERRRLPKAEVRK